MSEHARSSAHWVHVDGIVIGGHGVASGRFLGGAARGTITRQLPYFHARGLDLSGYYPATINVSIAPIEFTIHHPAFRFDDVAWTEDHGPETFSFSRCKLVVTDVMHDALLYYPHPETKPRHFQPPSTAELIVRYVPGIRPGKRVALWLDEREVRISRPAI